MDASTAISLASLVVALLALPTSYFVAVRQVKVSLRETDRHNSRGARLRVADALDEFFKVFYAAVKDFTGIDADQLQNRLQEIDPQLPTIDALVGKSAVLDQLASAIDTLAAAGWAGLSQSSELETRLQSIRRQVALGSDPARYATLGVISAAGGADLPAKLRAD